MELIINNNKAIEGLKEQHQSEIATFNFYCITQRGRERGRGRVGESQRETESLVRSK